MCLSLSLSLSLSPWFFRGSSVPPLCLQTRASASFPGFRGFRGISVHRPNSQPTRPVSPAFGFPRICQSTARIGAAHRILPKLTNAARSRQNPRLPWLSKNTTESTEPRKASTGAGLLGVVCRGEPRNPGFQPPESDTGHVLLCAQSAHRIEPAAWRRMSDSPHFSNYGPYCIQCGERDPGHGCAREPRHSPHPGRGAPLPRRA
jgi:hypothetical protein